MAEKKVAGEGEAGEPRVGGSYNKNLLELLDQFDKGEPDKKRTWALLDYFKYSEPVAR